MTTLDRLYRPHVGQAELHAWNAKEKWVEAARRWGKSRGAVGELQMVYQESLRRPISEINKYALVPSGFHAWVVAPSYVQGTQAWNDLISLLPRDVIRETRIADRQIILNGPTDDIWGMIELKTADNPDALQTVGLDFLWVTESQDVSEVATAKLRPALRSPGRLGRAIYEGIPALYPEHWFSRGCDAAQRRENKGHAYFHYTVYQNPVLSEEEKEEVENDREFLTQAQWDRMYLAKRSDSAGFFQNIQGCISGNLLEEPLPGKSYVGGLDLGVARDFTVLTIMDADARKVVFHQFWDSTPWPQVRDSIANLNTKWGLQRLMTDATGMGLPMSQDLMELNLPVEPVTILANIRIELLSNLQLAFERSTIAIPQVPLMIRQLRAFQNIRMSNGIYKAQAPPGEHDDEVFALALALRGCNESIPAGPARIGRSKGTGRYMPTMKEIESGGWQKGSANSRMAERRRRKTQERWDKAGVVL